MRRVLFRVDGGGRIGMGHVTRCLRLARSIQESFHGCMLAFAFRARAGMDGSLISNAGFQPFELPEIDECTVSGPLAHSHWLGLSQQQDAEETRARIAGSDFESLDWLIVDHYGIDATWESGWRESARNILVIDDLADRRHDADMLLDQNLHGEGFPGYTNTVGPECRLLLGPSFALLDPRFARTAEAKPRNVEAVQRILVAFGGVDQDNWTGKVLDALVAGCADDRSYDVLLGVANPHKKELLEQYAGNQAVRFHVGSSEVPSIMADVDLAIGAGGVMTWERCVMALPTIAIPVADNQVEVLAALDRQGVVTVISGDDFSARVLLGRVEKLAADVRARRDMARHASEVCDGRGAQRVVGEMSARA